MMTTTNPLATAWLDRVEALSAGMPEDRRQELLADLRDHLDAALPADPDAAQVEHVLARMGDPADIVAAARDDLPPPAPVVATTAVTSDRLTGAEIVTLVLFVLSGLLLLLVPVAVIAWVVAVVLLLTRDRWEGVENLVALLLPFGFAIPWVAVGSMSVVVSKCVTTSTTDAVGDVAEVSTCGGGGPGLAGIVAIIFLVAVFLTAAWGVVWLVRRIHTRYATS